MAQQPRHTLGEGDEQYGGHRVAPQDVDGAFIGPHRQGGGELTGHSFGHVEAGQDGDEGEDGNEDGVEEPFGHDHFEPVGGGHEAYGLVVVAVFAGDHHGGLHNGHEEAEGSHGGHDGGCFNNADVHAGPKFDHGVGRHIQAVDRGEPDAEE